MLEIDVMMEVSFDETTNSFVKSKPFRVRLEHSLFSVSKWESVWEEAFLGKKDKTFKQSFSYIEFMVLNDDLPPGVFDKLIKDHSEEIQKYITADHSATKLYSDPNAQQSREVVTSELIYYWMISMNIPMECQHWHLNRLITLIRVFNLKNSPKKKMSATERRNLNRSRQAKYNTRG